MKYLGKKDGISFIALVVTIIIILIIAGAVIAYNYGVIGDAKRGTSDTIIAQEKDQLLSAYYTEVTNAKERDLTPDAIDKQLKRQNSNATVTPNKLPIEITFPSGNKYTMNEKTGDTPISPA